MLAGLLGAFGAPDRARSSSADAARLEVFGPWIIRNGEFFEMRFQVDAREPIAQPVIAVSDDIWTDITINTMIPAATGESHTDEEFQFEFDRLDAGASFLFKVDGQINPDFLGMNSGQVRLLDGERLVTQVTYDMWVLP